MKNDNPTVKQHFVPQFYLKRFADSQKFLQVYSVREKRLELPRKYPGLGYGKYFYAVETGVPDEISQHIEDWLGEYENIIAQDLPNIIDKILNYKQITDDDKYILAALMCMLWLRSPKMRADMNRMHEDTTKQIMGLYAPQRVEGQVKKSGLELSEEQRLKYIKMLEEGSYDVRFNNAHHLRFMTETFGFQDKGFTNMFYGQKWKIYIAKGKQRFITTDSPVVEWWLPPKDFYGATFLDRNKYFALTPEIFIELSAPVGNSKVKRETLFEKDDNTVRLYNILLAAHSKEYAYSGEKRLLEDLIAGRTAPDEVNIAYYQQYERPWAEYRERQGIKKR